MQAFFEFLFEQNLTPNEFLVLYSLAHPSDRLPRTNRSNSERFVLMSQGYLDELGLLKQKGHDVIERAQALVAPQPAAVIAPGEKKPFLKWVAEYRDLFPTGLNSSKKPYRDNIQAIAVAFEWFFTHFPKYDWDTIIAATKYYMKVQQATDRRYISTAKYFVRKQDSIDKTFDSRLASYCQSYLDTQVVKESSQNSNQVYQLTTNFVQSLK